LETYTLYELNQYLRRVLALNVPDALWVQCEIASCRQSRGHWFLALLEKEAEEGAIIAEAEAVLWQSVYRKLRRKLGRELDAVLQEGMSVQLKMRVELHERYGLKMMVEDVDPAHTLGQMELQRQRTLQELERKNLLRKNAQLPLPAVVQRIAVLSSEQAAGWQDFREQLQENSYAYHFQLQLFSSAVQGLSVRAEMVQQFKKIKQQRQQFDAVVIIRGGGAKLDLAAFDDLELCKAIADCPLPVLTGIGHDMDETVADRVAHTALKTPTAAAEFLVQRSLLFESELLETGQRIQFLSQQVLQRQHVQLDRLRQAIQFQSERLLYQQELTLQNIQEKLPNLVHTRLRTARQALEAFAKMNALLSVESTLKRGYGLIIKNGQLISSVTDLQKEIEIEIRLKDGTLNTKIATTPHKKS